MTLRLVRIWLPAVVVVLGLVLFAVNPSTDTALGSAGIVGAGLSIWMLNVLFRIGAQGDKERDVEDDARRYFDEHGHWPDEAPGNPAEPPHQRPSHPRPPRRPV